MEWGRRAGGRLQGQGGRDVNHNERGRIATEAPDRRAKALLGPGRGGPVGLVMPGPVLCRRRSTGFYQAAW